MAAKGSKLEATLVSMTGSVIYLHDLAKTLEDKPIVPQTVTELMPETKTEVAALTAHFERALAVVRKEAQPFLDEWLKQQNLIVGGVIRGRTFRTHGDALSFEGGIEQAQLHRYLLDGTRVVDLTLVGARLAFADGGTGTCAADVPTTRGIYNLLSLQDLAAKDPITGAVTRKLKVRVPIQARVRDQWARYGNLDLT